MTVAAYPTAVNVNTGQLLYPAGTSGSRPSAVDQGLVGWTYDPAGIQANSTSYTAGVLHLIRVVPDSGGTVASVLISVATAGNTLANCFAGLYDSAGTLLSGSANQATSWQSTGVKAVALTTAQVVAAGSTYYVGVVVGSAVAVPALHLAVFSAVAMAGETAAPYRWMTSGSSLTALPASVALGSGAQLALTFWAGLKA